MTPTDRALAGLPDLIDVMIVAIRAGSSPSVALIDAVAHTDGFLAEVGAGAVHRLHRGERLADALTEFADRLGGDAAVFADTLGTADRYGLPLEPVLDRLATDSRLTRRRLAEQHARTLPVRLSFPLVICSLPGFVLCAIAPALLGALSSLRDLTP